MTTGLIVSSVFSSNSAVVFVIFALGLLPLNDSVFVRHDHRNLSRRRRCLESRVKKEDNISSVCRVTVLVQAVPTIRS